MQLFKQLGKWLVFGFFAPIVLLYGFVISVDLYFSHLLINKIKLIGLLFSNGILSIVISLFEDYNKVRDAYPLYVILWSSGSFILIGFNFINTTTAIQSVASTNRIDEQFIITSLAILLMSALFKFRIFKKKIKKNKINL